MFVNFIYAKQRHVALKQRPNVQKLEHDHSHLLRVVKKRIGDRKRLGFKVLAGFFPLPICSMLLTSLWNVILGRHRKS